MSLLPATALAVAAMAQGAGHEDGEQRTQALASGQKHMAHHRLDQGGERVRLLLQVAVDGRDFPR